MKLLFAAAAVIAVSSPAFAQQAPLPAAPPATFPVGLMEQDTANIRQVCDLARGSPSVTLETAAGVTQYCVALINRFTAAAAEHKKAAEAKPAEVKPPEEPKK